MVIVMTENKKKIDVGTVLTIVGMVCIVIAVLVVASLTVMKKVNVKDKINGITASVSAKKDDIKNQMKSQIAKAVNGEVLTATVTFSTGEAGLSTSQHKYLEPLRDYCIKHKKARIIIQGFADPTGSPLKNIALSLDRSKSVRHYFEYYDCHNIEDGGFGSKVPERQVVVTVTN